MDRQSKVSEQHILFLQKGLSSADDGLVLTLNIDDYFNSTNDKKSLYVRLKFG